VTCLFFKALDAKHHVRVAAVTHSNSTFTAQFFTAHSLNAHGGPQRLCKTRDACSFSAMEPFFVRLTTRASRAKTLRVAMVSLQFVALSAGCRAEEILPVGTFGRDSAPDVDNEACGGPGEEMAALWVYALAIGAGMAAVLGVLAVGGCLPWGVLCGWIRGHFSALPDDAIARAIVNPSDIVDALEPPIANS